jgi:hypothetical protein
MSTTENLSIAESEKPESKSCLGVRPAWTVGVAVILATLLMFGLFGW